MPVDIRGTLHQALGRLESEKARIERQIAGLKQALKAGVGTARDAMVGNARVSAGRRRMSSAARKAVSARMRAYWAKRKAARAKGKKKSA